MTAMTQLNSPPMIASATAIEKSVRPIGPVGRTATPALSVIVRDTASKFGSEKFRSLGVFLLQGFDFCQHSGAVISAIIQQLLEAIEDRLDLFLELRGFLGAELDELVLRLRVHHLLAVELDPIPGLDGEWGQLAARIVVDHLLQIGR